ncbi:helix-turn-helix domain-containing protein [Bacillus toyonensis]|uniref:helix-turn-helix domain-containing protein n=1 Tax=Bacillus toyonensis TaxID=155322 RepID=UPI001C0BCCD3|nr:helix-turn-helix transcriptional regulator [Bacillus toyonensis]MBU4642305.1 helix-turn-helix transcriptional regulator [Bacillus toyonensis]
MGIEGKQGYTIKINKKKVGERINNIRVAGGWNLEEFGILINKTSRGNVSNWISGRNIPTKEKLNLIAMLGKVKPEFLLYGDMSEYSYEFFRDYKGNELDQEFWDSFRRILTEKGIPYGEKERMIQYAVMAKDTLVENAEFREFSQCKGVKVETVCYYDVEKNTQYRRNYVPLLDELLRTNNDNKYVHPVNYKAILHTLVLLRGIDDERIKEEVLSIIINLSQIATPSTMMLDKDYQRLKEHINSSLDSINKLINN